MTNSLEQRMVAVEERLGALEREWREERGREARRRTRERWWRLAILLVVVFAYLLYLRKVLTLF